MTGKDNNVAIGIKGITKSFGTLKAVNELTLDIMQGEILGFLGPNGAGKSTSINMICGLIRPDKGEISINGRSGVGYSEQRHLFGLCPQEAIYWPKLTCFEQLVFMGEMYDLDAHRSRQSAMGLLEQLGLAAKAYKLANTLSGGMKRRLNIALALVHQPDIIVLDEPEAGLDPQSRVMVREFIRGLRPAKTVILTSHNMDEADRLSDRVAIMDNGRLLLTDTPENLKKTAGSGDVIEIGIHRDASGMQEKVECLRGLIPGIVVSDNTIRIRAINGIAMIPEITARLKKEGAMISEIRVRTNTLEDVFIQMTGKRLRE